MDEEMVLCAASSYEQKYYLNPEFESLPEAVKQELQIMCVLYTADVGGVLLLVFDENGNLEFRSLRYDYETNAFIFDPATTNQLNSMFEKDKQNSTLLTPEVWKKRSGWKKFVGWVGNLLTPFL